MKQVHCVLESLTAGFLMPVFGLENKWFLFSFCSNFQALPAILNGRIVFRLTVTSLSKPCFPRITLDMHLKGELKIKY